MNQVPDIYVPPRPGYERKEPEPQIDVAKCRKGFWWLTAWFVIWLPLIVGGTNAVGIFVPGGPVPMSPALYGVLALGSFFAFYIQLGRLAARNKKSWIVWALLPFMAFFIGGVIMYVRMIFLGRERGWL
jgi:hypothetical protein